MEVEDGHLLELAVKLPASMPLRLPELECRRKVGFTLGWPGGPRPAGRCRPGASCSARWHELLHGGSS